MEGNAGLQSGKEKALEAVVSPLIDEAGGRKHSIHNIYAPKQNDGKNSQAGSARSHPRRKSRKPTKMSVAKLSLNFREPGFLKPKNRDSPRELAEVSSKQDDRAVITSRQSDAGAKALLKDQLQKEQIKNQELVFHLQQTLDLLSKKLMSFQVESMGEEASNSDDDMVCQEQIRKQSRYEDVNQLLLRNAEQHHWTICQACLKQPGLLSGSLDHALIIVCHDVIDREEFYASNVFERAKARGLVECLISFGADCNKPDELGRSVFWLMTEENEIDFVEALIKTPRLPQESIQRELELLADPDFFVNLNFDYGGQMALASDSVEAHPFAAKSKIWSVWHIVFEKDSARLADLLLHCQLQRLLLRIQSKHCGIELDGVHNEILWEQEGNPLIICLNEAKHEVSCLKMMRLLLSQRALTQDEDSFATFFDVNSANAFGQTALHLACKKGFALIVKEIMEYVFHSPIDQPICAEINLQDKIGMFTPLMYGITFAHTHVVEALFSAGNLNVPTPPSTDDFMGLGGTRTHDLSLRCSIGGQTCLHLACSNPTELDSIVLLLCKNKINVNLADDQGFNGLHLASIHGHIFIARILLAYNAIVAANENKFKETALHMSAANGCINVLTLLLQNGAEVHFENKVGRTALHHAFEKLSHLQDLRHFVKKMIPSEEFSASSLFRHPKNFGFAHHPRIPDASSHYHRLAKDGPRLELEISRQNMVIKSLLEKGANLEHEDKFGETAFITAARQQYFKANKKAMMEIVNHPNELGYTNEVFIDKRTQACVRTMYLKSGSKLVALKNLVVWLLYTALLTLIALRYNGGYYFSDFAMEEAVKEKLVFEEFDPAGIKTFYDVMNLDDWNDYITNVFSNLLSPKTFAFSNGSQKFRTNVSSINGLIDFVGAPRIRQMRSRADSCINAKPNIFSMNQVGTDVCFSPSSESIVDDLPILCPGISKFHQMKLSEMILFEDELLTNLILQFKENDLVRYAAKSNGEVVDLQTSQVLPSNNSINSSEVVQLADFLFYQDLNAYHIWGNYGYYFGDGFALMIPFEKTQVLDFFQILNKCHFINMNSRIVSLDVNLFNRETELFSVANVFIELTASGHVRGNARFHTYKLLNYFSANDFSRMWLEILFMLMSINYVYNEFSSLLYDRWDEKYLNENLTPKYWFVKIVSEKSAIFHTVEDPNAFRILLTVPCCKKTLCLYKTSKEIAPYLVNLFNYIDLLIISLIGVLILLQFAATFRQNQLLHLLESLTRDELNQEFIDLGPLLTVAVFRQYVLGSLVFLCYIKILEFIQVSSVFAIPVIVIGGMFTQLLSFFVILLIFLLAFAFLKSIIYGLTFTPARTTFISVINTFSAALGDFDFDALGDSDSSFGYLLSIMMAFILVILLLNLLIAIMNEAYEDVRNTAEARWCYMQFRMIMNHENNTANDKFSLFTQILSYVSRVASDIFTMGINDDFGEIDIQKRKHDEEASNKSRSRTKMLELNEEAFMEEFGLGSFTEKRKTSQQDLFGLDLEFFEQTKKKRRRKKASSRVTPAKQIER